MSRSLCSLFMLLSVASPVLAEEARPWSVEEALREGIGRHPQLAAVEAQIATARVNVSAVEAERAALTTDISALNRAVTAPLLSTSPTPPNFVNAAALNGTVALTVPLFTGGKYEASHDQAERSLEGGRADLDRLRYTLAADIREAYWRARRAELRAETQRQASDYAARSARAVEALVGLGRLNVDERDRARVEEVQARADLARLEGDRDAARENLGLAVRRPVDGLALVDPPQTPPLLLPPVEQLIARARTQRADLRVARAGVGERRAATALASADRFPQVGFTTSYQHGNNPFDPTSQNRQLAATFAGVLDARVGVSYAAFDNGRVGREIRRRELAAEESEQRLADLDARVGAEVRQAMRAVRNADMQHAVTLSLRELAGRRRDWVKGRAAAGYQRAIDAEEAQLRYARAAAEELDSRIEQQLARNQLARAMGDFRQLEN